MPKMAPRTPQHDPKRFQNGPKQSKMDPKWHSKIAIFGRLKLNRIWYVQSGPQGHPKMTPKGSKMAPDNSGWIQDGIQKLQFLGV